jgi:hypothetical protein
MLAGLAVLPAGAVPAIATAAPSARPSVSDAYREARENLKLAHDNLKAAQAGVARGEAIVEAWERDNPEPTSRRGLKKWNRKWREVAFAPVITATWDLFGAAEKGFVAAQMALAEIPATNRAELVLKAALATKYDAVALNIGRTAVISFTVARDVALQAAGEFVA